MEKIRVLVVDDTVVVRKLVSDVLREDPEIEVVGVAANGKIALDRIREVKPDLITLDIEMPVMNGIETLSELRLTHPDLPVIMFSTLTERGAAMTLEALSRGATDYVTKPSQTGTLAASLERVREELLPKVRSLGRRRSCSSARGATQAGPSTARVVAEKRPPAPPVAAQAARPEPSGPISAVLIGVSTGGPNALSEVIPALPADLGVPILIVQHMPPMFTSMLAKRLDGESSLGVVEAYDGLPVEPGRVYLAQGGKHLELARRGTETVLSLTEGPEENSCRPAVDVLFRTAASAYGAGVLAVVLTGMGEDGLRGSRAIVDAGGVVLAQDEATSVVWGMPGAVVHAGLATQQLPIGQVAAEIARRVGQRSGSAALHGGMRAS